MAAANSAQRNFTIAEGQTESEEIDLNGLTICSLDIPAGVEGATISFEHNGRPFHDEAGLVSIPFTADTCLSLNTSLFSSMRKVKIITNLAQAAGDAVIVANCANFSSY